MAAGLIFEDSSSDARHFDLSGIECHHVFMCCMSEEEDSLNRVPVEYLCVEGKC